MVFLECKVTCVDPQCRTLNLQKILGMDTTGMWILNDKGHQTLSFYRDWASLQGPNGILKQLNEKGLVEEKDYLPFVILNNSQYGAAIVESCCII